MIHTTKNSIWAYTIRPFALYSLPAGKVGPTNLLNILYSTSYFGPPYGCPSWKCTLFNRQYLLVSMITVTLIAPGERYPS